MRYGLILTDDQGQALTGKDTYVVTVPPNLVEDSGYFSVTLYGTDNKLLIPNNKNLYDRTRGRAYFTINNFVYAALTAHFQWAAYAINPLAKLGRLA